MQSKILIVESVVVPATIPRESSRYSNESLQFSSVPVEEVTGMYESTTPPNFVPANFGAHAKMPLALGVHLMGAFNAYERTLVSLILFVIAARQVTFAPQHEWERIIHSSGLKIERVKSLRAFISVIECTVPIGHSE